MKYMVSRSSGDMGRRIIRPEAGVAPPSPCTGHLPGVPPEDGRWQRSSVLIAVTVAVVIMIAMAVAQLVASHGAVAVVVEAADHLLEGRAELLGRDQAVAVVVMGLEAVDHALAHDIDPERLILLEAEAPVGVGIELREAALAHLVDLGLRDAAVIIDIEALEQLGAGAAPRAMVTVMPPPVATGEAHACECGGAQPHQFRRWQKSG